MTSTANLAAVLAVLVISNFWRFLPSTENFDIFWQDSKNKMSKKELKNNTDFTSILNSPCLSLKVNPKKESYSIRSRNCQENSIAERVSHSQIVLSATCEFYRRQPHGGATCEKSRIWRIIKGNNLFNDIKDLTKVSFLNHSHQNFLFGKTFIWK